MEYKPTPRDLFNPPPQARQFSNVKDLENLREEIWNAFYDYGGNRNYEILIGLLAVIEDHEELIGVRS